VITRFGLLTLILALTACDSLTPREQRTVQRWLLCDECTEGELDSVVALGDRGVKALEAALKGPPKKGRENMELQAKAMFARIPGPTISMQKYVDHYLDNYEATYQSRAAIALARINSPRSRAVLLDALRRDSLYRHDVRRVLGRSRGAVVSIVAGDSQHAPFDSTVRIDPVVMVRDSTTGQELSDIRVLFRVDSGGGAVVPSSRLTGENGRAAARWRLGDSASTNVLSVIAAGQMLRFRAFGHPPGNRVVFVVQPSNGTAGQPVPPPPRIAVQDAWGTTQSTINGTAWCVCRGPVLRRRTISSAGAPPSPISALCSRDPGSH